MRIRAVASKTLFLKPTIEPSTCTPAAKTPDPFKLPKLKPNNMTATYANPNPQNPNTKCQNPQYVVHTALGTKEKTNSSMYIVYVFPDEQHDAIDVRTLTGNQTIIGVVR